MDLIELRARLRALARDPEEMAHRCGLPLGTVLAVLRGEIRPSAYVQEQIAKGVGADPEGTSRRDLHGGEP